MLTFSKDLEIIFLCLIFVINISLSKLISFKLNNSAIFSYNSSIPDLFKADIFKIFSVILVNLSSFSSIFEFKSDLFNKIIDFFPFIKFNISISSSSKSLELSKIAIIKSASLACFIDFSTPIFSTSSDASLIPAVSTKFNGIPLIVTNSSIVSLVVPAISVTIALSSLRIAFKSEDFPAFGFPIIAVFIPSFIIFPLSNDFSNFFNFFPTLSSIWAISFSWTSGVSYSG